MKIEADIIITAEDYTPISNILNELSLDINNILIICSKLLFQRFMQNLYDGVDAIGNKGGGDFFEELEKDLEKKYITLQLVDRGKRFNFTFIITTEETKEITHPTHGLETYKVGFNKITI